MKHSSKAFTLVESMVAISILALAVTGPMLIAQKGIGSAIYARDQITAFYLAQEAVEYIRNARDTNKIRGDSWLTGLTACLETGVGAGDGVRCRIDAHYQNFDTPGAIEACSGGTCPKLDFYDDGTDRYYGYVTLPVSGWRETAFTRTISVDNRASAKEAVISVTISWTTNLFAPVRSFTVKEYIFDF
jgi:prepilin-type N-terminal cleavage/methylation domain-containing protein